MTPDPRGVGVGAKPELGRQREGEDQADGDRLAVQHRSVVARPRLDSVAECVAEIEQRPGALLGLVAGDDRGLRGTALAHRVFPGSALAVDDRRAVILQPFEKRAVVDQPVFHDFGITGEALASRQRVERAGVGQHQARLVEGADEVLARPRVDRRLAADGAVDLGEERRRHLDESEAPEHQARRQPGDVADHPAAQRNHDRRPFGPGFENLLDQPLELRKALGRLAVGQDEAAMAETGGIERRLQPPQMQAGDGLVGDDEQRRRAREPGEMRTRGVDQPVGDEDVVGARAEIDSKGLAHVAGCAVRSPTRKSSMASATREAVARGFSSVVSTTTSASA